MMLASKHGNFEIAEILLQAGANTIVRNKDGKTALVLARENGYNRILSLILQ